ncbi:unnamed protein product, partial [Ceratitis capitata]
MFRHVLAASRCPFRTTRLRLVRSFLYVFYAFRYTLSTAIRIFGSRTFAFTPKAILSSAADYFTAPTGKLLGTIRTRLAASSSQRLMSGVSAFGIYGWPCQ